MYIVVSAAAVSTSVSPASAVIAAVAIISWWQETLVPGYLWNLMDESFSDSLSTL